MGALILMSLSSRRSPLAISLIWYCLDKPLKCYGLIFYASHNPRKILWENGFSLKVRHAPSLWYFLCLTWWFICPLKGYMAYSRLAWPSTSSYRVSTPTVFSFNVSPVSRRKTSLFWCSCSISNYYLISVVQLDKGTTGFQIERNIRIHKYCQSSLLIVLNERWPKIEKAVFIKLKWTPICHIRSWRQIDFSLQQSAQCNTSALHWISTSITSVYWADRNCVIINMPPEGWSGDYLNSSLC